MNVGSCHSLMPSFSGACVTLLVEVRTSSEVRTEEELLLFESDEADGTTSGLTTETSEVLLFVAFIVEP